MEHAMVSAATGVLSPVLGKLSTLLEKKYGRLNSVRDEIVSLKDELSSMNALLVKVADMDDLDIQVKEWRNQIRELSYDIEDCIDDFTHRVDHGRNSSDSIKGFFQKVRTLGARNKIANQIGKLKARVDDANERRRRYNFDGVVSSSSGVVSIDHRLPALYADAESLVGIDGPREEMIKRLTEREGNSGQKLKVVSVVGLGGLGKTTLVRQVYNKIGGQFDCRAFVSVSQRPNMKKILRNILVDVTGIEYYPRIKEWDERRLIDKLREFLIDKRFFIVIDDVWNTLAWRTIRCALLENNLCSIILTTTRIASVADSCCSPDRNNVCEMKPLSDVEAEKLFVERVFGSEDECPPQLKELSNAILKKCGGLPLAIISIASLLANKPRIKEQWERYRNSIGPGLEKAPGVNEMQKILYLSYNDLPHYLKTCLLYLSIFPEDHIIRKEHLVRRWIAEGFITTECGQNFEVGENYFNELINRSMIQPVWVQYDGQAYACRVHDMILDLIVSKSIEENFVTLIGYQNHVLGPQHMVRRLSLDCRDEEDIMLPSTMVVSSARSLTIYGSTKHMPLLSDFQALRVINIKNNNKLENHYLNDIGKLFQLKYLGLIQVSISKLPEQIGELQQLEIVELRLTRISELPKSIVRLKKLVTLQADCLSLPEGIGNMKALQELSRIYVNNSTPSTSLVELGSLTELKYLGIDWCISDTLRDQNSYKDNFFSSICRLCRFKLQCLHIGCDDENSCSLDFLLDSWSPPPYLLHNFQMRTDYYFPRSPEWVASLSSVTFLELNVNPVGEEVLLILGGLHSLLALKLWTQAVAPKERLIMCSSGFQCLKELDFGCWNIAMGGLVFEIGTMPKLEKFRFYSVARETGPPCGEVASGLQHIHSLKRVICRIDCRRAKVHDVEAIEAAVKNTTDPLPNLLKIKIKRYGARQMIKDAAEVGIEERRALKIRKVRKKVI